MAACFQFIYIKARVSYLKSYLEHNIKVVIKKTKQNKRNTGYTCAVYSLPVQIVALGSWT